MWQILRLSKKDTQASDKKIIRAIQTIAGFTPGNMELYRLATLHSSIAKESANGFKESNERLEYLGDAILGAVVADFLFKKFPYKDEGFLTEIRARLVNREALNLVARKMGINNIVQFDHKNAQLQQAILGNTLEAIVGAIYLDKGYLKCKTFVITKLIMPNYNLEELITFSSNFKSKLIEWGQRENKEVRFEIVSVQKGKVHKEFTAQVFVDGTEMGVGYGNSKKKAEQDAAFKTCEKLNIITKVEVK